MAIAVAHIETARISNVLPHLPAEPANWLSASEQARFAELRSALRRAQYLAGHWLARGILARVGGGIPEQWRLLERKSLPPLVAGHTDALKLSIAHTTDWIAAAASTVAIGIDLEQRGRVLNDAIQPLLLNVDEAVGTFDQDMLLQRWVAKEAWIKRLAGSALPAQLKLLQLRAASRDCADVRIDSNSQFHIGLAIAPDCQLHLHCEEPLVPGTDYAVSVAE